MVTRLGLELAVSAPQLEENVLETLWDWSGWLVAIILGLFAIRATVRFDVNEWFRDRRRQQKENLAILCPHISIVRSDGKAGIQSAYISPPGAFAWQCQMCGHISHDQRAIEQEARYWAENPEELRKRIKKIEDLAKKLGRM